MHMAEGWCAATTCVLLQRWSVLVTECINSPSSSAPPPLLILQIELTSRIPEMCNSHYGPPTHIPTWRMCLLPSVSMDRCSCTLPTTITPCLCKLTGLCGSFLHRWLPHGNI